MTHGELEILVHHQSDWSGDAIVRLGDREVLVPGHLLLRLGRVAAIQVLRSSVESALDDAEERAASEVARPRSASAISPAKLRAGASWEAERAWLEERGSGDVWPAGWTAGQVESARAAGRGELRSAREADLASRCRAEAPFWTRGPERCEREVHEDGAHSTEIGGVIVYWEGSVE